MSAWRTTLAIVAAGAALLLVEAVSARPLYFDNLTQRYGIQDGDDLHACGVCHRLWEGTGGRNPFGMAVEQQLYTGKSIQDSLAAVEPADTDGDGFVNVDELTVWGTLPGYSCDNYELAVDVPANFQMLITPDVPTCLSPKDLAVDPSSAGFLGEVGEVDEEIIELRNNGTDDPIQVQSVAFAGAGDPSLSLEGPAPPFVIPVGGSEFYTLRFEPTEAVNFKETLRVESDDPDQPTQDVSITGFAIVRLLGSPEDREACLRDVGRRMERYTRAHLKAWRRCFNDEHRGRACDVPRRDAAIAKAEQQLRDVLGGPKDRHCAAAGLTPPLLGFDETCGAPCQELPLRTLEDFADCLACQQDDAATSLLDAIYGVEPPDAPAASASKAAQSCGKKVHSAAERAIRKLQKTLTRCELDAILAGTPAECASDEAQALADAGASVNARFAACKDTTGLDACALEPEADPDCLGTAAGDAALGLTDALVGRNEGP